jgi:hypothetical protein
MWYIKETNMTLELICRIIANSNPNFDQILDIVGISNKVTSSLHQVPKLHLHVLHSVNQLGIMSGHNSTVIVLLLEQ